MSIDLEPTLGQTPNWEPHGEHGFSTVINIPDLGSVAGTVIDSGPQTPPHLYINLLIASQPGQGSGKALVTTILREGSRFKGAKIVSGHFTSPDALGAFASVVGSENVEISDWLTREPVNVPLTQAFEHPSHYRATAPIPSELS